MEEPRVRNGVRCTICGEMWCNEPSLHDVLEEVVKEVERRQRGELDANADPAYSYRGFIQDAGWAIYEALRLKNGET